jgi:hypothetical protein
VVQIWQTASFLEDDAIAVPPPRTRPEGGGGRYREERQGEDPRSMPLSKAPNEAAPNGSRRRAEHVGLD